MNQSVYLNKQLQNNEISSNKGSIYGKSNNHGLQGLVKGQKLTGLITSVTDGIKISLEGFEILAPKGMFADLTVGTAVQFEVLSITDSQIELSVVDDMLALNKKTVEAIVRLNKDREVLLSRKEQEGRQTEREEEHKNMMKKVEKLLSRMTEKDYRLLEEEGFSVEDFTVTGLEAAISRLHGSQKETAQDSQTGSRGKKAYTAAEIEQRLKEANLPSEADIVQKVMAALEISASIGTLDDTSIKYLIGANLPPTLENLYKAKYSRANSGAESRMDEEIWSRLLPQAEEIIRAAGYEPDEESLAGARWLLENDLPLTKENFIYYHQLSGREEMTDQSEVLDQLLKEMGQGSAPKDAIILPGLKGRFQKLTEKLDAIGEKEIREAVRTEQEINIRLLTDKKYREEFLKEAESRNLNEEQQLEAIRAQRLLEELRLKMTLEAAGTLERKGIHVETQSLEKLVEELKQLEDSYYRHLFTEADLEPDDEQIRLLQETSLQMEELKALPSYILGSTLSSRKLMTVPSLVSEGKKLTDQLDKAREAYETLMTEPNKEYGDSIQKAFKNAGSLLSELGLEDTIYNQRAIRILGYNQMEITQENLELVKAYDLEVNTLMQRLHPAVTVRLIKEGLNPLGIPISELNKEVDRLREEQGISSQERFSTFLRRLEKEDRIQEEERQAYIGIYRLLHRIDKSDGAALGAVLKAGREVTLNNLLTAIRSFQKGGIDAAVDDSFGMLEGLTDREATITDQLSGVFANTGNDSQSKQNSSPGMEARTEFLNQALKQLLSEASPEGFYEMQQKLSQNAQQTFGENAPMLSSGIGIWEMIKDVSAEKLFDMLSLPPEGDEVYSGKLTELKQVYQNSEQAIRFLEDFKLPCSGTNIFLAGQILSNSSSFFKRFFRLREENNKENPNQSLQEKPDLADTLIDRKSAQTTYEQMEEELKELLVKEAGSERIDSLRLTELKNMGAQMALIKTLASKEFYHIPIETEQGITGMNLTIVRGSGTTGKVSVNVTTEVLGRIKADISLKDRMLNGYIVSDSRNGIKLLQGSLQGMRDMLKEEKITVKQLEVCYDRLIKEGYSYQQPETEAIVPHDPEAERLLYRIARSVVLAVSAAEASARQETAVS